MTAPHPLAPSWGVLYCRVHQRLWNEAAATAVACDACLGDALTTVRGLGTLLTLLPPP
jgi:hypothetical protein